MTFPRLKIKQKIYGKVFGGYRKNIIKREEKKCKGLEKQVWKEITLEDLHRITEMKITKNRQNPQHLVEQFRFHQHKYNQLC